LKEICIKCGINSPLLGEAYDESKPSNFKGKQPFKETIQSLCQMPDMFFKYKKDAREALEVSEVKSPEYRE
jgi:hypothetical protein